MTILTHVKCKARTLVIDAKQQITYNRFLFCYRYNRNYFNKNNNKNFKTEINGRNIVKTLIRNLNNNSIAKNSSSPHRRGKTLRPARYPHKATRV